MTTINVNVLNNKAQKLISNTNIEKQKIVKKCLNCRF
jgi:hypothetical protein